MGLRAVSGIILTLLLVCMLTMVFNIRPVRAIGTIYIMSDGSVVGTDKIHRDGNVYTFTDNINGSIVVEKNNIVVDGAGYTLQGTGSGVGIDLSVRINVTIKNLEIKAFGKGIDANSGTDLIIKKQYLILSENNITNNSIGIGVSYSTSNSISGNNIKNNKISGIGLFRSAPDIDIFGNNIENNNLGIMMWDSSSKVLGNNITKSSIGIEIHQGAGSSAFYHNSFINNTRHVYIERDSSYPSTWDNGYPSGGNYWSDHFGEDSYSGPYQNEMGRDGIIDKPYEIPPPYWLGSKGIIDRYPLIPPWLNATALTVHTSGVSSHSPVNVTLNATKQSYARNGAISDDHPLSITLYGQVPMTLTIGIQTTRVCSINPNSRYSFNGWTGPATGTNTINPITVTLTANSSCTANYKTQYLTNIVFKDNSGTITLAPMQMKALAPNGSFVTLYSFSNQWLDNGTWTLKEVLWQNNNVKPSLDPTYTPTLGGTWNINCQVYSISFSNSFKDNAGNPLYALPSSFKLTFPNGTVSVPLDPSLSYHIQNGTTTWSSITWQGTEVTPSSSFDAADGDPTVNCKIYSLTVEPVFYDITGTTLVQPSSWSIEFPNGTTTTVSSPVTYNQTQAGNYSIVSIIWKGTEVVPDITPTISLTSDKLWSPSVNSLLPTSLSTSLSSSTSYIGFKVEINGNLTCNEVGLSRAPILLSYSVTGGETWNDITIINTDSDGGYSALWMPSATGNYLVRALWSGNSTYPRTNTTVNLAVIPFEEENVFSVTSNSTVSELAFNSTSRELSFTVTGPSGTTGYVNVFLAKTLVENIADVKVYLDGDQLNYTITSTDDSWLLHFTYRHSTHTITISLGPAPVPPQPINLLSLGILAVALTVVTGMLVFKIRRRTHQ